MILAALSTPAAVAIAAVGALLILGGLAHGALHWLGADPRWLRETRHAVGEAGWRASGLWAEFGEWLRTSR